MTGRDGTTRSTAIRSGTGGSTVSTAGKTTASKPKAKGKPDRRVRTGRVYRRSPEAIARHKIKARETQRELMRKRRADPQFRVGEQQAKTCITLALDKLRRAHGDEYLALLQAERRAVGLPVYLPRGTQGRRMAARGPGATLPADPTAQAKCRHNEGIQKLGSSKYCNACGAEIR